MRNIFWPKGIEPRDFRVHSYNSIFINTPKQKVWEVLIDASEWPKWYPNSKDVKIKNDSVLKMLTEFVWKTFGLTVRSQVIEYKEFESIGWSARELGGVGYHGWRLIEQDAGTLIVTEEVQRGWGVSLLTPLVKHGLQKQHQIWLQRLKGKCE